MIFIPDDLLDKAVDFGSQFEDNFVDRGPLFDPLGFILDRNKPTASDSPWDGGFDILKPPPATVLDSITTPSDVQAYTDFAQNAIGDFSADIPGWLETLFNTSEQSAALQWQRNENSARNAYVRSELAADNALRRARQLRQSYYQDVVNSLKAAGLNPVLAAQNGISGASTTAPQANAPSATSSIASGINGADLLSAIAAIISASGNLMKGISSFLPTNIISNVTQTLTKK